MEESNRPAGHAEHAPLLDGGGAGGDAAGYDAAPAKKKSVLSVYLCLCVAMCTLSSILLGYDVGVITGAKIKIQDYFSLSDFQTEVLVGLLQIMAAFGGLTCGWMSDAIGRKRTIGVAAIIFIAGAATMSLAQSYWMLIVGRIITGVGVGTGIIIAPLYTAEISPARIRGSLVSWSEVLLNVGIVLGYVSNYAFYDLPDDTSWRWMLGVGIGPPIVILLTLFWLPESPRWLFRRGRLQEASAVLCRTCDAEEAALLMQELHAEGVPLNTRLSDLLHPSVGTRRLLVAGIGTAFMQQLSGSEAIIYYTPEVLNGLGLTDFEDQLLATMAVGAVKVLFIFVAMALLDRVGRRTLLLVSAAGMTLSLALMSANYAAVNSVILAVVALGSFMAFFSSGFGPTTWVLASEIFPLSHRGFGMGCATFANRFTSGVVASSFLSLQSGLTAAGAFGMYCGLAVVSFAFVWYFVPETKGKTLEEIEAELGSSPDEKEKEKKACDAHGSVNAGNTWQVVA